MRSRIMLFSSAVTAIVAATALVPIMALSQTSPASSAANYPQRPIRIVVPYPPGGTTDILARVVGVKFTETWRQQVVVDNRPGAGGNIGTEIVAKASPDGYTLVMSAVSTLAIGASLYRKLPYDVLKDLGPVALVGSVPNVLIVHPSLPAKSVKELIALAKTRPGQINFASAGTGTTVHFAGELFKSMAGVNIVHVPYKGAAPAMIDLLGGQVQMMFDFMSSALPQIKAGKVRALAVTPGKRSLVLPELPTVAEAGVPGYEVLGYFGVLAPGATPRSIVTKLNAEINRLSGLPDVKERFAQEGVEPSHNSAEEFRSYLNAEVVKWAKVVKESGVRVE